MKKDRTKKRKELSIDIYKKIKNYKLEKKT